MCCALEFCQPRVYLNSEKCSFSVLDVKLNGLTTDSRRNSFVSRNTRQTHLRTGLCAETHHILTQEQLCAQEHATVSRRNCFVRRNTRQYQAGTALSPGTHHSLTQEQLCAQEHTTDPRRNNFVRRNTS